MQQPSDQGGFWRKQAANLPSDDPMVDLAKRTWRMGHPRLHAELRKAGVLDDAAKVAAANYRTHVRRLIEQGASPDMAHEWAFYECIVVEPTRRETREERELGEELQLGAFERWLRTIEKQDSKDR